MTQLHRIVLQDENQRSSSVQVTDGGLTFRFEMEDGRSCFMIPREQWDTLRSLVAAWDRLTRARDIT